MRQLANLLPCITIRNEMPSTIKEGGNLPTCTPHTRTTKQTAPIRFYRSPAQSHGDNSFRYSQLADRPPLPASVFNKHGRGVPAQQTRGKAAIKMEKSQCASRRAASPWRRQNNVDEGALKTHVRCEQMNLLVNSPFCSHQTLAKEQFG